jgi:hypothetical protein
MIIIHLVSYVILAVVILVVLDLLDRPRGRVPLGPPPKPYPPSVFVETKPPTLSQRYGIPEEHKL